MGCMYRIALYLLTMKMCMTCPVSITTLAYVSSCPKTQEEWRKREESKRCSLVRQKCTSPINFVYHCVLNNFANATLEVCAEETLIIDNRCAEFNMKAEKIVESQTEKCEGFCPFKYNSTEAYKYQVCYPVLYPANSSGNASNKSTTSTSAPAKSEPTASNSNWHMILAISFTGILSASLIGITLRLRIKYIRMKKKQKGTDFKHGAEEINSLLENKENISNNISKATYMTNAEKGDGDIKYNQEEIKESENISNNISKATYMTNAEKGDGDIKYNQEEIKESDFFIIAIDIGEKYYGLAHTDLKNPQVIISSHPMERIAVLIEKPKTIKMVGKDATNEFIRMKADDLLNHVYINEVKPDKLDEKVPETELTYLKLFTAATLGVINRIEGEICEKMKNIRDVRVVFSAGCHWRKPVKDLIDDVLKKARKSFNWEEGQEKVAFIEKVRTVSQFIREAEAATYCLNYNIENLTMKEKKYAVLNVGFGSCHLTFLHYRDEKNFDIRDSGGRTRRDWNNALPEDKVWSLFQEMIDDKYINQQNHVRVIHQYENLHERIRMCRDDGTIFEFSFPVDIFKENFRKIAEERGIEIQEKDKNIILLLKWYLMKTFFKELKETVNDVIEENKDDFTKLEIKCVFLIGGYSIMKMIQDAARNEWFKHITIMIPDDAGVCYAVGGATAGARGVIKFDDTEYKNTY